jgi:hypothetical protein
MFLLLASSQDKVHMVKEDIDLQGYKEFLAYKNLKTTYQHFSVKIALILVEYNILVNSMDKR